MAKNGTNHKIKHIALLLGWNAEGLHRGVAKFARERGWALDVLGNRLHRWVPGWQPDGIICLLGSDANIDAYVRRVQVPVVNIGYNRELPVPSVSTDNRDVAQMAVSYFQSCGFSDVGYYYTNGGPCDDERLRYFRESAARSKLRLHILDTSVRNRSTAGADARFASLRRSLHQLRFPLGMFVENDDRGVELITACLEEGIGVPEQVAVLAVNNDVLQCEFSPVPLSSIDENMPAVGYAAAQYLDRLFRAQPILDPDLSVPPLRVVARRSTDVMAINHPVVRDLLQRLAAQFNTRLSARTAASWAPLSRRHLHALFKRETGRSIAQYIMHLRISRAEQLLVETEIKQRVVAERAGFSDEHHLIRAFRRIHCCTPSQYRRAARCGITLHGSD
jgi:LacI family transcriptional regulator